ncbi:MAG TPA: TonB-dependent receptor [Steroidobacteraceae bacterium]|nr:TonB-dependent receptor [Steroidobacteraceae bacterium]
MQSRTVSLRHAIAAVLTLSTIASVRAQAQEASKTDDSELTEIVVTGSRIRNAAPVGSNVIGMDRTDLESATGLTVDRMVKELPQVLDLGVSESSRGQAGGAGNIVFGNTINLRGLGPYATLILVDGHRTISNSRSVDPSVIPGLGLERVEILADGSSAVYGSDAVAGVVNLIPRRNLNGVDTSVRYGTGDAFHEYQIGAAGGKVWDSGQVMVAFEHSYRSALNGDDRDFFTSDQRNASGTDYRTTRCSPGTISVGTTNFAIPAGGVTAASASSLVAGSANRCDVLIGQDLLPMQKYDSMNSTFTQSITDWMDVFADGFYSRRTYSRTPAYANASLAVPSTNAWFVQPPGTTGATTVAYNFMGDLPRDVQTGKAQSWEVTPGLRFKLPHDIRIEALFTYGKGDDQANQYRGLNNGALNTALASNNPATAFDPYGLHRTSPDVLALISNQIFLAPTLNKFRGAELRADGRILTMPSGDLRFAAGYERQEMDVQLGSARGNPTVPITYRRFFRNVDSVYAEFYIPIVGNSISVPGIKKLELTAALREDKYTIVGNTTNPKFGLNYVPVDSVKIRATYGTSFRAPLISEIYGNSRGLFGQNYQNPAGGAQLLGFALSGQNLDLKPEESRTWTAGIDWTPLDDTKIALTYFNIKYESQVTNYLSNLSVLTLESDFAGTGMILRGAEAGARVQTEFTTNGVPLVAGSFPGGNPANATLFVDGRNRNLGTSLMSGIDFQFTQKVQTASAGTFKFNLDGTYLTKFDAAVTSQGRRVDRLNTIFNPLKFRARGGVTWDYGSVSTRVVLNYVNSYDNNNVTPVQKVKSYTPVDLSVMFHGDNISWLGSFGNGLLFGLDATNVFDTKPPYVNVGQSGNGGGGFDPTAANPIGRLIGVRLQKNWR